MRTLLVRQASPGAVFYRDGKSLGPAGRQLFHERGEVERRLLEDIQLADHHHFDERHSDVHIHVALKRQDAELVVLHEADLLLLGARKPKGCGARRRARVAVTPRRRGAAALIVHGGAAEVRQQPTRTRDRNEVVHVAPPHRLRR